MRKIGVLALQGSVREHVSCLEKLNTKAVEVRKLKELQEIDGLILPGGESTTMSILLNTFELMEPLREKIKDGLPVWGTCAGMILLAKRISGQEYSHLGVMDIEVVRNAYGSQLESFSTAVPVPAVSPIPVPLVFIRAPYIKKTWGDTYILLTLEGKITAARQGNMLATSFHPELTDNLDFYRYFLTFG